MNAVEVEGLDKRYGGVRALDDVSVSIPHGTLTLVSGPNGAGKSTLLRILASLTRPTRGQVRILGIDPFGSGAAARRGDTGYLGHEMGLYAELTVRENLAFCARLHGLDPTAVERQIEDLGLRPVARQRARTLSLGYRRRAALARARLTAPPLMLLDEPWNGLDPEAAHGLSRWLSEQREAGRSALVAAHGVHRTSEPGFDAELRLERGRLVAFDSGRCAP